MVDKVPTFIRSYMGPSPNVMDTGSVDPHGLELPKFGDLPSSPCRAEEQLFQESRSLTFSSVPS
jgi:hypothetical protein